MRHVDDERLIRINYYHTKSAEEWKERGRFWEGNQFNKVNKEKGLRVTWRDELSLFYSDVKDDHAVVIKERIARGARRAEGEEVGPPPASVRGRWPEAGSADAFHKAE